MTFVDHFTASAQGVGEPIEAVGALARAVGCHAIAREARRLAERLYEAHLFVAVAGPDGMPPLSVLNALAGEVVVPGDAQIVPSIPIVVRYGQTRRARVRIRGEIARDVPLAQLERFISAADNVGNHRDVSSIEITVPAASLRRGVCVISGLTPETRRSTKVVPRVDVLVAVASPGGQVTDGAAPWASLWGVSDANTFCIGGGDLTVSQLERALDVLASQTGAVAVQTLHDQEVRRLCLRVQLHLHEQRRALDRPEVDVERHVDAVHACVILAEHLLEERANRTDPDREELERALAVERTKFLMSVKADVLSALGARLADAHAIRDELRDVANTIAEQLGCDAVLAWHQRLRPLVDKAAAAMGDRMMREARASFGPLLEWVPALALIGVAIGPIRATYAMRRRQAVGPGVFTRLGDRVRLAGGLRRRAEQAAADVLMQLLETESRAVVKHDLRHFDAATSAVESWLRAMLDQLAETARVSASRACEARSRGPEALAEERRHVDSWLDQLAELTASLDRIG